MSIFRPFANLVWIHIIHTSLLTIAVHHFLRVVRRCGLIGISYIFEVLAWVSNSQNKVESRPEPDWDEWSDETDAYALMEADQTDKHAGKHTTGMTESITEEKVFGSRPQLFPSSTQLSMKFQMLMSIKI